MGGESRQELSRGDVVLLFNPAATTEIVRFDEQHACLVIDDALLDPEGVVRYAVDQRHAFRPVDFNFYPGTYLMATAAMTGRLTEYFQFQARRHFDARRCLHTSLRYSLITRPPRELRPPQWLCHRDDAGLPPGLSMQACVLYLFQDPLLGGTAFYAPDRTPAQMQALFADAAVLPADEFAARYGLDAGYMADGNGWFRRLGGIEAKWNRLIIYDGALFHTGDIRVPARLSEDPATGRLTLNGFFTSRRHAVAGR